MLPASVSCTYTLRIDQPHHFTRCHVLEPSNVAARFLVAGFLLRGAAARFIVANSSPSVAERCWVGAAGVLETVSIAGAARAPPRGGPAAMSAPSPTGPLGPGFPTPEDPDDGCSIPTLTSAGSTTGFLPGTSEGFLAGEAGSGCGVSTAGEDVAQPMPPESHREEASKVTACRVKASFR